MKPKKEFETYNEAKNVPEVFSFSEKENEKQFLTEDFVFKFEDNEKQTGIDLNIDSTGLEENENSVNTIEIMEEEEKREQIKENVETSSSSSSASAEATTATTTAGASAAATGGSAVAAAVTTVAAVILVVGGGLAISESYKKPSFCEFQEIFVEQNNIYYMLMLGMEEENEQSQDGTSDIEIENEKTDCIVELTYASNSRFVGEIEVGTFGITSGEFNNLEYNTTYCLNVYRPTMLGFDREYLLEEGYYITIPEEGSAIAVEGIEVDAQEISLTVGENSYISYRIYPENASDQTVTFISSDEEVAKVDENGMITALSEGEATITLITNDGGYSTYCVVYVEEDYVHVTSVSFEEESTELAVGSSLTLEPIVLPENATDKSVTYSSSDESIAIVDDDGLVTGLEVGQVTITCTTVDMECSASIIIDVFDPTPTFTNFSLHIATSNVGNEFMYAVLDYEDKTSIWGDNFTIRFFGDNASEFETELRLVSGSYYDILSSSSNFYMPNIIEEESMMLREYVENYQYQIIPSSVDAFIEDNIIFSGYLSNGYEYEEMPREETLLYGMMEDDNQFVLSIRLNACSYYRDFSSVHALIKDVTMSEQYDVVIADYDTPIPTGIVPTSDSMYEVTLMGTKTGEEDEVLIYSEYFYPSDMLPEPELMNYQLYKTHTNSDNYLYFFDISVEDTVGYYGNEYTFKLKDPSTSELVYQTVLQEYPYDLPTLKGKYVFPDLNDFNSALMSYDGDTEQLEYSILVDSSYPDDGGEKELVKESFMPQYIEGSIEGIPQISFNDNMFVTVFFDECDYLLEFDSVGVLLHDNVNDNDYSIFFESSDLGTTKDTDAPVSLDSQNYTITVVGYNGNDEITIYVEDMPDFGIH